VQSLNQQRESSNSPVYYTTYVCLSVCLSVRLLCSVPYHELKKVHILIYRCPMHDECSQACHFDVKVTMSPGQGQAQGTDIAATNCHVQRTSVTKSKVKMTTSAVSTSMYIHWLRNSRPVNRLLESDCKKPPCRRCPSRGNNQGRYIKLVY